MLGKISAFLKGGFKWTSFVLGLMAVAVVFFVLNSFENGNDVSAEYDEYVVIQGDIQDTIKVSGQAELVNEQELRFNMTGTVSKVYVEEGVEVKKDQLIMELDKADLNNEIKQAEISLSNAQITLKNLEDGNSEVEILKGKNDVTEIANNVEEAEINLEVATQEYEVNLENLENDTNLAKQDVENKERLYEVALKNLENTKLFEEHDIKESEIDYIDAHNDVVAVANDTVNSVKDVLLNINTVMEIEGHSTKSSNYHLLLGAGSRASEKTAEKEYDNAVNKIEEFIDVLAMVEDSELVFEEYYELLAEAEDLLDQTVVLIDSYSDVLNASIDGNDLSASMLESFKSEAINMKSSINNQIKSVQDQISTLEKLEDPEYTELQSEADIAQKEDVLNDAEYNLQKGKNSLELLEAGYEANVASEKLKLLNAESDLESLQDNLEYQREVLEDLIDGVDLDDIQKAKNDVAQKQLSLEKVRRDSEDYEIIAPFEGILRQNDYQVGDNILADDEKYVYIENPSLIKVEVSLDQIDVIEVKAGQNVNVYFDSFPEELFNGTLDEINQIPVESSGVVTYTVGIMLNNPEEKIFSGMTASVEIITSEVNDVLISPLSYVTRQGDMAFVLKKSGFSSQKVKVEIGDDNGKNVEIVNGLSEGDVILSEAFKVSEDAQKESGGMFGGAPPGGGQGGNTGGTNAMKISR